MEKSRFSQKFQNEIARWSKTALETPEIRDILKRVSPENRVDMLARLVIVAMSDYVQD